MTEINNQTQEQRIESWKEIAAYLKRDVRTVIRWEKTEGLPVHRQMHQARGSVFAYATELAAWKASRELKLDKAEVRVRQVVPAASEGYDLADLDAEIEGEQRGQQDGRWRG